MSDSVMAWLTDFEACVRARDFDRGRLLCSQNIVSFGTVTHIAVGLEQLVNKQWSHVWNVTRDFAFDYEHMQIDTRDDLAWVATPWTSHGFAADGSSHLREGRATIVLRREYDGWVGIHTHFSIRPRDCDAP
jgi:ketosteroid isomerase-like protein